VLVREEPGNIILSTTGQPTYGTSTHVLYFIDRYYASPCPQLMNTFTRHRSPLAHRSPLHRPQRNNHRPSILTSPDIRHNSSQRPPQSQDQRPIKRPTIRTKNNIHPLHPRPNMGRRPLHIRHNLRQTLLTTARKPQLRQNHNRRLSMDGKPA